MALCKIYIPLRALELSSKERAALLTKKHGETTFFFLSFFQADLSNQTSLIVNARDLSEAEKAVGFWLKKKDAEENAEENANPVAISISEALKAAAVAALLTKDSTKGFLVSRPAAEPFCLFKRLPEPKDAEAFKKTLFSFFHYASETEPLLSWGAVGKLCRPRLDGVSVFVGPPENFLCS